MKKLIALMFLLTAGMQISKSQHVNFADTTWSAALEMAAASNKHLFVDAYTTWCGWCKVMDKQTFTNEQVADRMNSSFVSLKIDMEKGFGIDLARKYVVTSFPTFLIFNSKGQLVYRIMGFREAENFIESLNESLSPQNESKYKGFSPEINMNYPRFYSASYGGSKVAKYPTDETVSNHFKSVSDRSTWLDEVNYKILLRFNTGKEVNDYFLENINKAKTLYGETVDEKVATIIYNTVEEATKKKNQELLYEAEKMIDQYYNGDKESFKTNMRLEYYFSTKDWGNFGDEFERYILAHNMDDPGFVNNYCWKIYEDCNEKFLISKACNWMKDAVARDAQYMYLDTYAALLYKSGNTGEAISIAKKAIEVGKANGENVKETEDLLKKMQAPVPNK